MLTDLFSYLTTAPGVDADTVRAAALTGMQALVGTRVYPDYLKERGQLPALTYQLIDNKQDYNLDGSAIDIVYPRVQLDVYSNSAVQREAIGEYVKTALAGYMGTLGGTSVALLMFDNELNSFEDENVQYRKTLDFKVIHYT